MKNIPNSKSKYGKNAKVETFVCRKANAPVTLLKLHAFVYRCYFSIPIRSLIQIRLTFFRTNYKREGSILKTHAMPSRIHLKYNNYRNETVIHICCKLILLSCFTYLFENRTAYESAWFLKYIHTNVFSEQTSLWVHEIFRLNNF